MQVKWLLSQNTEWSESIEINNKPVCFQLDTDANFNVLPLKTFVQHGLKRDRKKFFKILVETK